MPYLQPVDSEYDELSPYYEGKYTISEEDFADAVDETYGIDLYNCGLDPEDWILIDYDEMASGDYVGRVEIGGEDRVQGGDVSRGRSHHRAQCPGEPAGLQPSLHLFRGGIQCPEGAVCIHHPGLWPRRGYRPMGKQLSGGTRRLYI